ncbi:MAG: hypothetical protein QOJ56_4544 [Mycobacterium sp.]|jgi:hypothetical protein|nr:hypothetical protein [Mycobacterium sp.]MDT5233269.1 hypothetical protein [Mycobacterium sp.]MDT5321423.1 hypothetical protein [Mycobacterium sp.]MDT5356012.1 hypothetical protein [Mycobacterium sp.]
MTSKTDNTDLSALTGALDDTAARIRDLNEKVIAAAKQSGTESLDAYEKTLTSLLSFGEKVAGATQLDWVSALAKAHATFVTETTAAFTAAARDALK